MNSQRYLALLTPLLISSVAFAPAVAAPAPTATTPASVTRAPSAACTVTDVDPTRIGVGASGEGFTPGDTVKLTETGGKFSIEFAVEADGTWTIGGLPVVGDYRAITPAETVECTTVDGTKPEKPGQSEQERARAEFRQGQKDGFALGRELCEAAAPKKGVAALDPNYERGFESGKKSAIDQFCN
ncbi:hypothetical protein [Streptomyces sp. F001]|uniref:hypothetical protein n=1 Tax=Streptomyces sp. F001 TaxID=1510026 RepID=UPI00101E28E4|nr:hypothetical protein [Streptomyces sp. F001]RZB17151.1 hypothetical protein StrepF001_20445 [Streptomyces sp. F001]